MKLLTVGVGRVKTFLQATEGAVTSQGRRFHFVLAVRENKALAFAFDAKAALRET